MTRDIHVLKRSALLLASVSTIGLLAGCSLSSMKNPFDTDRPPQSVPGERHPPVLNVSGAKTPKADVVAPAPASTAVALPKPAPFVAAVPKTPVRKAIPGNYADPVDTSVVNNNSVPSTAPAPLSKSAEIVQPAQVESKSDETTSALFNNALSVNNPGTTGPAPWRLREPFIVKQAPKHNVVIAKEQEAVPAAAAPMMLPPEMPPEEKPAANPTAAEKIPPTPALSSVPKAPAHFGEIKSGSSKELKDLQADHEHAQQDKTALDNEPSQKNAAAPEEPAAAPVAPVEAAPAAVTPLVAPAETPASKDEQPKPALPQRGVDIMTQKQWQELQKARQAAVPEAKPEEGKTETGGSDTLKAPAEEGKDGEKGKNDENSDGKSPAAAPQSFLIPAGDARLIQLAADETVANDASKGQTIAIPMEEVPAAAPSSDNAPAAKSDEAKTADPAPATTPSSDNAPAAKSDEAKTADPAPAAVASSADEAAATAEVEMVEKAKTLPASRYAAREHSLQQIPTTH